jgi:hypothetical protein
MEVQAEAHRLLADELATTLSSKPGAARYRCLNTNRVLLVTGLSR